MSAPRWDEVLFDSAVLRGVPFKRFRVDGTEPEAYAHTRADAATCASYLDRDGVLRKAAANKLRCSWDYATTRAGLLLEGARTNLVGYSENFGSWSDSNTPVKTSGQSDPAGGTAAYLLNDDNAGATEAVYRAITFTGDGTKALALYLKAGTAVRTDFTVYDSSAATNRHFVRVTWAAGVPTLSTVAGSGVLFPVEALAGGWYRVMVNVAGIVAANVNQMWLYPAGTLAPADTGTVYAFGVQAENALYPSSYIKSDAGATVSRAADALTFPIGFAPQDLTAYLRFPRPPHADAGMSLPFNALALAIGGISADFFIVGRNLSSADFYANAAMLAIPAGASLEICAQMRNPASAPETRLSVGGAFTAWVPYGSAFTAWGAPYLYLGGGNYAGLEWNGAIERLVVARGLFTLAEMQAAPAP